MRNNSDTWHVQGRRIGPFELGEEFQPHENYQKLKRYIEEDFDTFVVDGTNHSKVGVVDGRVVWELYSFMVWVAQWVC